MKQTSPFGGTKGLFGRSARRHSSTFWVCVIHIPKDYLSRKVQHQGGKKEADTDQLQLTGIAMC